MREADDGIEVVLRRPSLPEGSERRLIVNEDEETTTPSQKNALCDHDAHRDGFEEVDLREARPQLVPHRFRYVSRRPKGVDISVDDDSDPPAALCVRVDDPGDSRRGTEGDVPSRITFQEAPNPFEVSVEMVRPAA